MRKISIVFFLLFTATKAVSQCAMCKAVIENGDQSVAKSINNGITYLMVFPYILVGILFYFIYKHKKKIKS